MGLVPRWFERKPPAPAPVDTVTTLQREESRRELLNVALRETLRKHGIPQSWIQAEMPSAVTSRKVRGTHLRLVVRDWHPELLAYTVGLQRAILARLLRLDPKAAGWLAGISWQYDPVDDSTCPALPPPQFWAAHRNPVPASLLAERSRPAARTDFPNTQPMHG